MKTFRCAAHLSVTLLTKSDRYLHKELKKRFNLTFDRIEVMDCIDNVIGEIVRFIFYEDYHICGVDYKFRDLIYGKAFK